MSRLPRRNSGREAADTTVSAEECAKKITTRMGGDFWSGRRGSLAALPRRDTHTGTKACPRHVFLAALVPFRASSRGALFQKETPSFLRRFIGTICEPTPLSKYLFLWKEAVFRHSLPFLFMRPHRVSDQPQPRPCSEAVRPPDRCHGSRSVPPAVRCGSISPRALRPPLA